MIDVVWGTAKDKPESSRLLAEQLADLETQGQLYIGYPIMGSPMGPVKFDALLISQEIGLVAFDLVEGTEIGAYENRQDDIASMLERQIQTISESKTRAGTKICNQCSDVCTREGFCS